MSSLYRLCEWCDKVERVHRRSTFEPAVCVASMSTTVNCCGLRSPCDAVQGARQIRAALLFREQLACLWKRSFAGYEADAELTIKCKVVDALLFAMADTLPVEEGENK